MTTKKWLLLLYDSKLQTTKLNLFTTINSSTFFSCTNLISLKIGTCDKTYFYKTGIRLLIAVSQWRSHLTHVVGIARVQSPSVHLLKIFFSSVFVTLSCFIFIAYHNLYEGRPVGSTCMFCLRVEFGYTKEGLSQVTTEHTLYWIPSLPFQQLQS